MILVWDPRQGDRGQRVFLGYPRYMGSNLSGMLGHAALRAAPFVASVVSQRSVTLSLSLNFGFNISLCTVYELSMSSSLSEVLCHQISHLVYDHENVPPPLPTKVLHPLVLRGNQIWQKLEMLTDLYGSNVNT